MRDDGSCFLSLCFQPELDQAADGFGAVGVMILAPLIDRGREFYGEAHSADRIASCRRPASLFLVYLN